MKRILFVSLIILTIFLSLAYKQDKETNLLLPPEKGSGVTFRTSNLIYQNDRSTLYSIAPFGSIITFYDDTLNVNDNGEIKTYEISYDGTPLIIEDFKKQFQPGSEIPEISSYKNIVQYNLCKSTNDLPGYRLYVLDGQYWMGTLYKNSIWRIVSLEIDK